jgi:hypothetical protein
MLMAVRYAIALNAWPKFLKGVDATGEMIGVAQPPKATACMILVGSKVPRPPSTRIVNRMTMA